MVEEWNKMERRIIDESVKQQQLMHLLRMRGSPKGQFEHELQLSYIRPTDQ